MNVTVAQEGLAVKTLGCSDLTLPGLRTVLSLGPIWEAKPWSGNQETEGLSVMLPPTWRTLGKMQLL